MMFKKELTVEELRQRYPAIFAESPKSTTSDQYLYIPTYKLIQGLETQGFKIAGAKQSTSRTNSKEHGKHVVYLTHEDLGATRDLLVSGTHNRVDSGEIPMLALTNSHNGLSAFAIDTAFYRLVCSNGLMMPTTSLNTARIIHKIGMQDDVINAAYSVLKAFPEQIKMIEEMKKIEMSREEQILLAESAVNLTFEPEQIELNKSKGVDLIKRMLYVRRAVDNKADLWNTFNAIQENVIKGGHQILTQNENGKISRTSTRAVNSIDRDSKLNKELMALAQKFAALRGAA